MADPSNCSAFVEAMSGAVDVPIPMAYRDSVVANLERIHAIAQLVLEFPPPSDIEPASTFEP
ncbi:MAG: DUF4089 domain-containing protein [Myxacorys californica WJT36-NPBG1]|jgi:hypothetical protein|nr:DUF4089 domain-containing protein [Myxacorys californica WJT36-NPBG1]